MSEANRKFSGFVARSTAVPVTTEAILNITTQSTTSEIAQSVKYELVGTPFFIKISRDKSSQLIAIELIAQQQKKAPSDLGRWIINAYQVENDSITLGGTQAKISCSPFYLQIRFYQRTFGVFTEMASMIIRPKVLRPGDIPVTLSGAWIAAGGIQYNGTDDHSTPTHVLTRYAFKNSNLEVCVGKSKHDSSAIAQVSIRNDDGSTKVLGTFDQSNISAETEDLKVGQLEVSFSKDEKSIHLKFKDKTFGMFPTEVGYISIGTQKNAENKAIPVYLSGNWSERGVNFDKAFQ